jgi:hypothetical protein
LAPHAGSSVAAILAGAASAAAAAGDIVAVRRTLHDHLRSVAVAAAGASAGVSAGAGAATAASAAPLPLPQPPLRSPLTSALLPLVEAVFSLPTVAQVEAALDDWARLAPPKAVLALTPAATHARTTAMAGKPAGVKSAAVATVAAAKPAASAVPWLGASTATASPSTLFQAYGAFAAATAATLQERSPMSKRIASAMHFAVGQPGSLSAAVRAPAPALAASAPAHVPFNIAMALEYRVVARVSFCAFGNGDFHAGVRAHLIDKTGRPQWGDYAALWRTLGAPLCLHCAAPAPAPVAADAAAFVTTAVPRNRQTGLCVDCDARSQLWVFHLLTGIPMSVSVARTKAAAAAADGDAAAAAAVGALDAALAATAAAAPELPVARWRAAAMPTEGVELFEHLDHSVAVKHFADAAHVSAAAEKPAPVLLGAGVTLAALAASVGTGPAAIQGAVAALAAGYGAMIATTVAAEPLCQRARAAPKPGKQHAKL